MTRRSSLQLFALVSLAATIGYARDRSNSYGSDASASPTPVADRYGTSSDGIQGMESGDLRLREGMKFVNRVGELRAAGGQIVFFPDGGTHSLQLLENLALERISRDLDQTHRKWSVTGIVTEYRGGNYLLLHRAVMKARVSHPPGARS